MKLFYSWQSDLPSNSNKNYILGALEKAIQAVKAHGSIEEALRPDDLAETPHIELDHDTVGAPGLPDIAQVIFEKIDSADIFAADVTFIGASSEKSKRLVSNPNVLIELGYAMKAVGQENIILVMDIAQGAADKLPFDLRGRRWPITFDSRQKGKEGEKNALVENLTNALIAIINSGTLKSQNYRLPINPTREDALTCVLRSDAKADWVRNDQGKYYRHNTQLRLQMHVGDDSVQCEDFIEPWANCFPSKSAKGYWCDLYFGSTRLERFILVAVDGGRCLLPVPLTDGSLAVSDINYKIALIHDVHDNLYEHMLTAGLSRGSED